MKIDLLREFTKEALKEIRLSSRSKGFFSSLADDINNVLSKFKISSGDITTGDSEERGGVNISSRISKEEVSKIIKSMSADDKKDLDLLANEWIKKLSGLSKEKFSRIENEKLEQFVYSVYAGFIKKGYDGDDAHESTKEFLNKKYEKSKREFSD